MRCPRNSAEGPGNCRAPHAARRQIQAMVEPLPAALPCQPRSRQCAERLAEDLNDVSLLPRRCCHRQPGRPGQPAHVDRGHRKALATCIDSRNASFCHDIRIYQDHLHRKGENTAFSRVPRAVDLTTMEHADAPVPWPARNRHFAVPHALALRRNPKDGHSRDRTLATAVSRSTLHPAALAAGATVFARSRLAEPGRPPKRSRTGPVSDSAQYIRKCECPHL